MSQYHRKKGSFLLEMRLVMILSTFCFQTSGRTLSKFNHKCFYPHPMIYSNVGKYSIGLFRIIPTVKTMEFECITLVQNVLIAWIHLGLREPWFSKKNRIEFKNSISKASWTTKGYRGSIGTRINKIYVKYDGSNASS